MMASRRTPYLDEPQRLAEVIAAIQAMSSYKFYKLGFAPWAVRIFGDEARADQVRRICRDPPEFFRIDTTGDKASLVARRQRRRVYHVDLERNLSSDDDDQALYHAAKSKGRLSRSPLSSDETAALIATAIELHARELEQSASRKWWLPLATAVVSALAALGGAAVGVLFG